MLLAMQPLLKVEHFRRTRHFGLQLVGKFLQRLLPHARQAHVAVKMRCRVCLVLNRAAHGVGQAQHAAHHVKSHALSDRGTCNLGIGSTCAGRAGCQTRSAPWPGRRRQPPTGLWLSALAGRHNSAARVGHQPCPTPEASPVRGHACCSGSARRYRENLRQLRHAVGDNVRNNGSPSSTRAPNKNRPTWRRTSTVPGMVCSVRRTSRSSSCSGSVKPLAYHNFRAS